jgi:uncharacterized protein DUF6313
MRSLRKVYDAGGDERQFAEDFVDGPHRRSWSSAGDHWERTVTFFLRECKDLEVLDTPEERIERAEEYAMATLWPLALLGRCPHCPRS